MMKKKHILLLLLFLHTGILIAQDIPLHFTQTAPVTEVYGKSKTSSSLISFNDLDIEFGYVLYQTELNSEEDKTAVLQIENIRDYAAVYINDKYVGSMTSDKNSLSLALSSGQSTLKLYVENIGRITYGPEILDNSKGLFGKVTLDKKILKNWTMIPLNIRSNKTDKLTFTEDDSLAYPYFLKTSFNVDKIKEYHLDLSGWGMVEVWVNNQYAGSYWEEESQKSIPLPSSVFKEGKNEIILFEMKNNETQKAALTDKPVFN